ncbi:MAG: hypothetical protein ACKVOQ_08440 [Cyclobacteriaceae bacterium]
MRHGQARRKATGLSVPSPAITHFHHAEFIPSEAEGGFPLLSLAEFPPKNLLRISRIYCSPMNISFDWVYLWRTLDSSSLNPRVETLAY